MTVTPWGNAAELRSRRLRPGPGTAREDVEANQRERLMAAMVAAVDEHGYETARVADVVRISGVSRSDFYAHFEDKADCFLATADAIAELAARQIAAAFDSAGAWDARLRAATDKFLELVLSQPAAARLCLVEIYAAGPDAVARLDAATQAVERAVSRAFEDSPERAGMPRDIVRAIVGGLNKAVHSRLRRRDLSGLAQVVPELFEWGIAYRTPPEPLRRPRRQPIRSTTLPRAKADPRTRLTRAVAEVVVEKGYPQATIAEIADRAKASLSTFYGNFETKGAAFHAAIEQAQEEIVGAAAPAYEHAADWRYGVRDGLDAMFGHLAAEPVTASVAVVEALAAGADAVEESDGMLDGVCTRLLAESGNPRPIVAEAIGGAIYSLVYTQVRLNRGDRMRELTPTATYVALAPSTEIQAACSIANEPLRSV